MEKYRIPTAKDRFTINGKQLEENRENYKLYIGENHTVKCEICGKTFGQHYAFDCRKPIITYTK